MDRLRALRLLKLSGDVADSQAVAVCEAWEFAYSLRADSATDSRRSERYRRLAAGIADARRVLLGDAAALVPGDPAGPQPNADATPRCGADWARQGGLSAGATLAGRFELVAARGTCGLGCVFDAWDREKRERRTLEVLAPALEGFPAARQRYLSTARAVGAMGDLDAEERGCGLARVYDVLESRGLAAVSLEPLPQQTLRDQMLRRRRNRRAFTAVEVRTVLQRLARTISRAVLHGITAPPRPEFLWLREDGTIRLLHFSVSSAIAEAHSPVPASVYAPPESLSRAEPTGEAALQYMLGVLAHELLTGEVPHGDPARIRGDAPRELLDAVVRLLARDPRDRFPSLADLARALGGAVPLNAPSPPRPETRTPAPRSAATGPAAPAPPARLAAVVPRRRIKPGGRRCCGLALLAALALLTPFHGRLAAPGAPLSVVAPAPRPAPAVPVFDPRSVAIPGSGHADEEPADPGAVGAMPGGLAGSSAAAPSGTLLLPPVEPQPVVRGEPIASAPEGYESAPTRVETPPEAVERSDRATVRGPEAASRDAITFEPDPPAASDGVLASEADRVSAGESSAPLEVTVSRHEAVGAADAAPRARALSHGVFPMTAEEAGRLQLATARRLGLPHLWEVEAGPAAMELVLIPEGEFVMGSPSYERGRFDDEGPLRAVTVARPYYLGRAEVTERQWSAVMGAGDTQVAGDADLPVVNVSWHDAVAFCARMSDATGRVVRLPTEAEWEYACRTGRAAPYSVGEVLTSTHAAFDPDGSIALVATDLDEVRTAAGSFPPNPWNLFDMHGGVCEWCADAYAPYGPAAVPAARPAPNLGQTEAALRVVRGGSWATSAAYCRSAARARLAPDARRPDVGFRVVVECDDLDPVP